ncbi:MAG: hypothetical protein ABSC23_00105 [Bryobacteraceae bacterium]|jgi:hypothetical protein
MRARLPRESGQAIILMSMSLVVVVGMIGLVVDIGWAHWRKEACKTASQAAVMAAVKIAKNATDFTCGSGVTCQGNTACPATLSDDTNALQVGCMYAQQNGFTNGGSQTVLLAANTTAPPVTGTSPTYWVSATVSETVPQWFGVVLGQSAVTVAARSTAAVFSSPNGGCVFVLNATAASALNVGSGTSLTSGCGVYVDSSSGTAASVGGAVTTTGAAKTEIVGNCSGCGNISPAPITGAPVIPDPFSSMTAPSASTCLGSISLAGSTTQTFGPGTYCGSPAIQLKGSSHLILKTGTYVLQGKLSMAGGTQLTATGGVMLYFSSDTLDLKGGAQITLTAQTSGAYEGILIWQDKSDTSGASLVGGGTQFLNDALYFPKATLTFQGGTSATHTNTTIAADKLALGGSSYIQSSATTPYTGGSLVLGYIE